jgi:CTP synthase (UTP-ammonia lyase)
MSFNALLRHCALTCPQIACRCERDLDTSAAEKIAHFCQVELNQVVIVKDMPSIYQVPLLLEQQGYIPLLTETLALKNHTISPSLITKGRQTWAQWQALTGDDKRYFDKLSIVLVGKYTELHDSYMSVVKALEHCAMRCRRDLKIEWVDSEHLETKTREVAPALFHKAWHVLCTAQVSKFGVRLGCMLLGFITLMPHWIAVCQGQLLDTTATCPRSIHIISRLPPASLQQASSKPPLTLFLL